MDAAIRDIFGLGNFLFLSGLVAAGLFFAMAALREIQSGTVEALLFFTLAAFFFTVHFIIIGVNYSLPALGVFQNNYTVESWFIEILGPAVVLLLLLIGGVNILQQRFSEAVIKLVFGLGIWALLNEMGRGCPEPAKIALLILTALTWIGLELRATPEM
jgi:phosphoglycerol transferase MdoB-like AlkP superfamily enzyme